MTFTYWAVNTSIKRLARILCRVEDQELCAVPQSGPLILVCNHINFLDAPVMYTHLQPRPVTGFAKAETWEQGWLGTLFTLWGAIPLRRGSADTEALRKGLQALEQGKIVAFAPEGTRSGHGRLQKGHPGVVALALHSGAPLLPVAFYGNETFHPNLRRLKRTDFHIRVGRMFCLDTQGERVSRELRQRMLDEIMGQLAALLPPENRGVYAGVEATTGYLRFEELIRE